MRVTLRFANGDEVTVEGFGQLNLLAHAQLAERSAQSRCGGQCECGTCRVRLIQGKLSPMKEPERELLERVGALKGEFRLACQAFPEGSGDVVVEVPKERFRDARKSRR
jgi:2Fe-2S ferredoxin